MPSKDKLLSMLSRLVEQEKDLLLKVDNRLNLQMLNEKSKRNKHYCNDCLYLAQFRDVHNAVKLTSTDQSLFVMPCDNFF